MKDSFFFDRIKNKTKEIIIEFFIVFVFELD
jgi:hypothetical protein